MDKKTYFLAWLKARRFTTRRNVIRMFGVNISQTPNIEINKIDQQMIDNGIITKESVVKLNYVICHDGVEYYTMVDDAKITLGNYDPNRPYIDIMEKLTLDVGDLPNITEPTITTYGVLYLNYYCLIDIVGGKFPYFNKHSSSVTGIEEALFAQNKLPDNDPNKLDISTEIDICRARLQQLGTYTSLFVPAATERVIASPHPIIAKRNELLKQYVKPDGSFTIADITYIKEVLGKMLQEYIEADPNYGGLITSRTWDNTMMSMNILIGGVARFDKPGTYDIILQSYSDGLVRANHTSMTNVSRAGSFFKGHETQLGGIEVKRLQRIDAQVTEEDCKTTHTMPFLMNGNMINNYIGRYRMLNGASVPITKGDVSTLKNTVVHLRSPTRCNAKGGVCLTCMGERFRGYESRTGMLVTRPASDIMNKMMKAIHDTSTKLCTYTVDNAFC